MFVAYLSTHFALIRTTKHFHSGSFIFFAKPNYQFFVLLLVESLPSLASNSMSGGHGTGLERGLRCATGHRWTARPCWDTLMCAQCNCTALCQGTLPFHSTQQNVFINISLMLDMCAHAGCSVHYQQVLIPGASGQAAIAARAKRAGTPTLWKEWVWERPPAMWGRRRDRSRGCGCAWIPQCFSVGVWGRGGALLVFFCTF